MAKAKSIKLCMCGCGEPVRSKTPSAAYRRGHRARSQFGSPEERFWLKTVRTNGCWLWIGKPKIKFGYGELYVGNRTETSHRYSWVLHNGPIPEGMQVLHRCDNPRCVRPEHLFLGTIKDNMADKVAKGRQPKGDRHGQAKLTSQQAVDIKVRRRLGEPLAKIAADYRVSVALVSKIAKGKLWKHLGKE